MKVAVFGATGYTGALLLRILAFHTEVASVLPVSRSKAGDLVFDVDPGLSREAAGKLTASSGRFLSFDDVKPRDVDVVISALPHLTSATLCRPFVGEAAVVDLSADFRHRRESTFRRAYGRAWPEPDLQGSAVYGLAEWNGHAVESAAIVANPGCYPTACLLPLLPLLRERLVGGDIIINALSGISGAGRKEKTDLLYCERTENANAYNPGRDHRHAEEIAEQLEAAGTFDRMLFTPHLVPMGQGMAATTVASLAPGASATAVRDCLVAAYGGRPFVVVTDGHIPETKHVRGTNRCDVAAKVVDDRVMLFSVIDNLWKGAAGQAVQNMNLRMGLPEDTGLLRSGEV